MIPAPNGHGKYAAPDNEARDARFPLSGSPPEGESDEVSLREFHVNGIKKQVFGVVLFSLGTVTALLANVIGFELDVFYVVISFIGACLFLYGAIQKNRHELSGEPHHADSSFPR